MPLKHYTERNLVRLLATRSRRTDITPWELTQSHVELGSFLAGELVELLDLEPCEIQHPQGIRQGWRVAREEELILLPLLRAGLYTADGVREVLRQAAVVHISPKREIGLSEAELGQLPSIEGRTFILIDSVVNTGASLEPVLRQLRERGAGRLIVVALVGPATTAKRLETTFPEVHFFFARISENQYTGVGATDTGNRLFGTLPTRSRE
ncbi:uracil phosphoribosyltransferase [Archangium gephyra]|uniref:uracil phosphoribosyltransferase n=1 Tax=Archangium gephyra TaxID=48 RepID=UPI003B77313D